MKVTIFHSKMTVIIFIFLFVMPLFSDPFSRIEIGGREEVEKLIQEGKNFYREGKYYRALNKLLEAENLLEKLEVKDRTELTQKYSQIYLNLALTYYATNQMDKVQKNLQNLFAQNPDKTLNEIEYPLGFIKIFNKAKEEYAKAEERPEKIETEDEKQKKEEFKQKIQEDIDKEKVKKPDEKKARSFISFRLDGGMNYIDGGDINTHIKDHKRRISYYDKIEYYTGNSETNELHLVKNLKGEIIFNLSKNFGIGLGAEYFSGTGSGTFEINYTYSSYKNIRTPVYNLDLFGIFSEVYAFIPLKIGRFYLIGGAGYYSGKFDFYQEIKVNNKIVYTFDGLAKSYSIGLQGGLGIDIDISSILSFFIEGKYHILSFNNWKGNETSGISENEYHEGYLWYYEYHGFPNNYYSSYSFSERSPSDDDYRNIRKFEVNVSGPSLSIGLKINF